MYALLAGALFAGDMLPWAQAILEIGVGLSIVIVNLQVVLVPVLAWLVDRERVPRRYLPCVGVMLFGVVLNRVATRGHHPDRADPGRKITAPNGERGPLAGTGRSRQL